MPVKIGFHVISCSGEDDRYRVNELNYHGPTVRGWRSSLNCQFPQEIVFRLQVAAVLRQIQILVHQYLIPQKIEIYTYDEGENLETAQTDDWHEGFEYLGFITFSDNNITGFRSRELKSILIPSKRAKFLKLRIHKNHPNDKNLYNQVGIIGINVLGDEIDCEIPENEHNNNNVFHRSNPMYSSTVFYNPSQISPYDDLAFEMYVDEETANIIKVLVQKKQEAVFEENFELANLLKLTLRDLRAAGEILGLYEQEKKQAIQMEDFDRAKLKKLQISNFREKVYSTLNISELISPSDTEEYTSLPQLSDPKNENMKYALKSISKTDFYEKYLNQHLDKGISYPKDNYIHSTSGNQNGNFSQIKHSKSQISFEFKEFPPLDYLKNQPFTASISNPQIHFNETEEKNFQTITQKKIEPSGEEPDFELGEAESSTTTSSSSVTEESAVFNGFPSETTDYASLPILPMEEQNQVESEKNESFNAKESTFNETRTPPPNFSSGSFKSASGLKPLRPRSKSVTSTEKNSFEAYEDRMLPALRSYHGNEIVRECQFAFDHQTKTSLNERERKQAALPISVFGIETVEKFYSKSFNEKEEGLILLRDELKRVVETAKETNGILCGSQNKMARAAIFLLHRALRDKVYSVYSRAAETIRLFFTEFVPQRVSSSEVVRSVEKLLPELLAKSGDVTSRIHNMAAHTILSIAECEEVRRLNIIPTHLSRPLLSSIHPRLALSRLEMVEQLILNHGISKDKRSGLTCRTLAEFGASGLHHPAESVRKVSERILIHIYKVNPRMVRKQLPPDDSVTRRNLLYRQLFQEFDFMDAQKKLNEQYNERNEPKDNISSLNRKKPEFEASFNQKIFSINNNLPDERNKSPNFDSQLKAIKNFMTLNFREKNTLKTTSHNSIHSRSPSKSNKEIIYNDIKMEIALGTNSFKKKLPKTQDEKKFLKSENPAKLSYSLSNNNQNTKKSSEPSVKFPYLTDSIDTTKARLLLEHKKNPKSQKFDHFLPKERLDLMKSLPKKEIKRNMNFSSGIPLPIFKFSTKYFQKPKKEEKKSEPILKSEKKTSSFIPQIKSLTKSKDMLSFSEQKKLKEIINLKREKPDKSFKSTAKAETCFLNNCEKTNRFSDSILASIKESEHSEDCHSNNVNKDKEETKLKSCIFCLCSSEDWTTVENLNEHYLNDCPMLMTCEYCMEVIEISGFTNHLLDECTQKHLFQKCFKCQQPVLADFLNNHECADIVDVMLKKRCPFCHKNIGEYGTCWRDHFMGLNKCPNHPRAL